VIVDELWLGRPRVLSLYGRDEATQRWYDGEQGPYTPMAQAAGRSCATCGFLMLMRGAVSRVFGVCANELAPDDGRVVSFDHGCGAHSEALVVHNEPRADVGTNASADDGDGPAAVEAGPEHLDQHRPEDEPPAVPGDSDLL
jgi:hypothetical protein